MFGLEGVPAIYINSLFGAENDLKGAEESQMNRRINREKWNEAALSSRLQDLTQREGMIFSKLRSLLNLRSRQSAFHPNATQFTLQVETSFFGVWRQSQDRRQSIFAVTNLTTEPQDLDRQLINLIDTEDWVDLISGDAIPLEASHITFAPYQTVWITNRPN
jgi:sucrose phosphorylase